MTQRERVHEMLKAAGPRGVTTGEFMDAYIVAYSQRIGELRKLGVKTVTERIQGTSQSRYTLAGPESDGCF